MLLEMHCHTAEHSPCSHVPAAELVRRVFARGLQGVVFTDHHYLWPAQELAEVRRAAGVPGFFLLLSGQEVRTPELGDVLVYGASESLPAGTPLADLRLRWPGAALVWAHPYRRGRRPAAPELANPLVDGVEIFSSNHSVLENSRGLRDWHAHKFTALAGTDSHGATYAGTYPTQFDHPFDSVEGLAEELRRGRCRPFFKEIPRAGSQIQVTEIAIGTKGESETRERLILKVLRDRRKWHSAARAYRVMAAVSRRGFDGGPYRVPRPIDRDEGTMTLIEEGVRGRSLFDRVRAADPDRAREFVGLAARWLARLHNCRLAVTPAGEFLAAETRRLGAYVARFEKVGHPHTVRARQVMEAVRTAERTRYRGRPGLLVQGHGDYHPKNVYIGQDRLDDRATLYVAAIDFDSSYRLPPACDVGTFVAQFRNQLFGDPQVLREVPEAVFLDAYLAEAQGVPEGFLAEVELFRARTNLGIAAYLIKLGLGQSENLWRVLVEAEAALVQYRGGGGAS